MIVRMRSEVPQRNTESGVSADPRLQFSKSRLTDFGELPRGKIPFELEQHPQFKMTTLKNEARICSEQYPTPYSVVSINAKIGTRFEEQETSGAARFLSHMFKRGTQSKSIEQVQ